MATRIFYSCLIGHTQFVHTPNKQMQNRACSLMNLHSHRSSVEKKYWPSKKKMIWRCIYGTPIIPVPRQQGLIQTERKVDNYRLWYIWSSMLKERYLQEIKDTWILKSHFMCLILNEISWLNHRTFHIRCGLLMASSPSQTYFPAPPSLSPSALHQCPLLCRAVP